MSGDVLNSDFDAVIASARGKRVNAEHIGKTLPRYVLKHDQRNISVAVPCKAVEVGT